MLLVAKDVVGAVSELVSLGYTREYRIEDRQLYELSIDKPVPVSAIYVDCSLRLESNPNAGDGANIYAISDRHTDKKGLLIDAFDILDQECSKELSSASRRCRERLSTVKRMCQAATDFGKSITANLKRIQSAWSYESAIRIFLPALRAILLRPGLRHRRAAICLARHEYPQGFSACARSLPEC